MDRYIGLDAHASSCRLVEVDASLLVRTVDGDIKRLKPLLTVQHHQKRFPLRAFLCARAI